jgi:ABC-type glycerol-3-phosphate transport system permease component
VFITVVATLLTLLINSMAAFALSKYQFRGQKAVFLLIIATLMIPPTIILVPVFLVINTVGLLNSLWGVILPAIATPTGVFLLRQYMLTIPDELLEAARMDHASEWRIYWKIILPLAAPALAVLAIFSVMWRWNDFLLPLIVLSKSEYFTLAAGAQLVPGRAQHPVALPAGHDGDHADPDHAGVCLPAKIHHHRHCQRRREITTPIARSRPWPHLNSSGRQEF